MTYLCKCEYRGSMDMPDSEEYIDANSAEDAFYEFRNMFGLAMFRGPISIYDENKKLVYKE